MNSIDFRENYEQFLMEADQLEIVWNLKNKEGFAISESTIDESLQVMPFWSNEKAAKAACNDDWSEYQPNPIAIDDFIDAWLHGLEEDGIAVGVNWSESLEGVEIEPVILIDDLLGES